MPKSSTSLRDLEHHDAFVERHIGPNDAEVATMLSAIGHDSLESMTDAIVPASIRSRAPLALPDAMTEVEALARIRDRADRNQVFRSFIGQGYYGTHTPNVILRNILENPAWYTAYTPYQAEISQGRMEALINFQTMCADLTGMEIANASLLDEATAAAEAMTLARRSAKSKSNVFAVSRGVHPQSIEVVRTRAEPLGIEVVVADDADLASLDAFGVLLQYPDTFGTASDYAALAEAVHARNGLVSVATDLLALTLLKSPGAWGADIVVGNTQRFGVPFGFGGPHAAFMACRDAYKRSMPGRLIGVSVDTEGNPAYRLTLQTREQHIRREKATSNICTAQVLLAVMASMYAVYHGPEGLTRIARRTHRLAAILAGALRKAGTQVADGFFDTLHVTNVDAAAIHAKARALGINLRAFGPLEEGDRHLGISLDETTTRADVVALASLFGADLADIDAADRDTADALPPALLRDTTFLDHPVFNTHHSEHELLRYMRALADKDLAMDRTMIPLGSCTMKLNATAEMVPVTWPEFANIHPLAPDDQAAGYHQLIDELEAMLSEITGYDAVSLQPNSGAQGEYAGLLAIRAYHRSRGDEQRDICLIPESAHGTNPASAQLCGMQVVVTRCDKDGNVDIDDIRAKAAQEPVLRTRFEVRACHGDVDALAQRQLLVQRDGARDFPEPGVVRHRHVRKAGAEAVVVRPDERAVAEQVDVVGNEHEVARPPQRVHPPAGVGHDEHLRPERAQDAHREGHPAKGVALVAMEAALHRDDRATTKPPAEQATRVRLDRRECPAGDVRIVDRRLDVHAIGQRAKPGAEDDRGVRQARERGADTCRGFLDPLEGVHVGRGGRLRRLVH